MTADEPMSVSVMVVPTGVAEGTFTIKVNAAVPPLASELMVQFTLPVPLTAGVVQLQPAGLVIDAKVVLVGTASENVTVVAVAGPLFFSDCVYVMVEPAATVVGEAELVTAISALVAADTSVLTVAVLLERVLSSVEELTESVSVMVVPVGTLAPTCTTKVNVARALAASVGVVQEMLPVAPTAGVVQVHPLGTARDVNVVLLGMASLKTALMPACGPLLLTVWV